MFTAQSVYKSPLRDHKFSPVADKSIRNKLKSRDLSNIKKRYFAEGQNENKHLRNKELKKIKHKIERYTALNYKDNIELTNKSIERIKLRRKMYKLKQH